MLCAAPFAWGQQHLIAYAGNSGREAFFAVSRLSDGTFLVGGAADDLNWIDPAVPRTELPAPGINNPGGSGRIAFILHLSADLQTPLDVLHLPAGAAEDIRFIKQSNLPNAPTDQVVTSGNTTGGYFLGKLNGNWVDAPPTGFAWAQTIAASGYVKENHPWDVDGDGRVVYISGETHGYNWSAMYRLDAAGQREVVEHWRVHWKTQGGEWRGTPASAYGDPTNPLSYSGVVFKRDGRCELRSHTQADFDLIQPDGNGGMKKGKWPLDFMYAGPCDPNGSQPLNGPGYTGYSPAATPVYGASVVTIDRRDNSIYLGMNVKTTLPDGNPDFEPAVIKFTSEGALAWWSRLYHEIQPGGAFVNSSPDQYVDGIAVDYSLPLAQASVVVNARCHGNNAENLWEGDQIATDPGASGFQNRFTGTNGNIHISWLGKLSCTDGTLRHSTYVAEYAEGANTYGSPHPDPNLGGWPDPNTGWPNVNTTRLARCAVLTTADGSVCIAGTGRRTITTANAWQQMPLPASGLSGAWNQFVRVYTPDLLTPKYSSLLVGQWNTANGSGGDNTDVYGLWKTADGIVAVGRHRPDPNNPGQHLGAPIPTTNVPAWGQALPQNESAILAHFTASALADPDDGPSVITDMQGFRHEDQLMVHPNPAHEGFSVTFTGTTGGALELVDATGRLVRSERTEGTQPWISAVGMSPGIYSLRWIPLSGPVRTCRVAITGHRH
ncbi:MAG: hypothetical protein ACK4L7_05680 [Flavobacteriales bacterium]